MTTTQTHAAQVLTDAETDQHLDAVLNGAGSALRHYTTEFSLSRMRAAMREHEAAILAKLQPAQAGELPEPDAVFYCSEDTGYLTQYRNPPANLTDGDVAMYEADTVRAMLDRAALAARKPLTRQELREAFHRETRCTLGGDIHLAEKVCAVVERAHGIGINSLEVKT